MGQKQSTSSGFIKMAADHPLRKQQQQSPRNHKSVLLKEESLNTLPSSTCGWEGTEESNPSSCNSIMSLEDPSSNPAEGDDDDEVRSETTSIASSSNLNRSFRSVTSSVTGEEDGDSSEIKEFFLKKRRPNTHKHGLHWQEDPTGRTWLHNNMNWPRDFAVIRGTVITVTRKTSGSKKKWLLATEVKQPHSEKWRKAPKGAALPFFYGTLYMLVPNKTYVPKQGSRRSLLLQQQRRESNSMSTFDTHRSTDSNGLPPPPPRALSILKENSQGPQQMVRFISEPEVIIINNNVSEEPSGTFSPETENR